ncbi:MAG: tRNA (guanosine(46)-N7)-methyltransferase TrmB [Actinobacteria bacterium]|nr:tRNA (guanosine(46)-N7)-methyltransferase TrmB [Actinomycetota bacterium]
MERPSIRSYQLRGARMTKAQRQAIENHQEFLIENPTSFHPRELFPEKSEVVVEIGSGMGEATAEIAKTFPEKGFLAIEVHRPGIGSLILRALALEVANVKMINDDCHLILINEEFSRVLATKLRTGGVLRVATDWQEYATQIRRVLDENPDLTGGIVERPEWRPLTKFESQGINKEHRVTDFLYTKI